MSNSEHIYLIEYLETSQSSSHGCQRCNKTLASPQSLRNHKQRCREQSHAGNISSNDIREQDVPRKRLWDNSSELNVVANKTSKPLKIQRFNP